MQQPKRKKTNNPHQPTKNNDAKQPTTNSPKGRGGRGRRRAACVRVRPALLPPQRVGPRQDGRRARAVPDRVRRRPQAPPARRAQRPARRRRRARGRAAWWVVIVFSSCGCCVVVVVVVVLLLCCCERCSPRTRANTHVLSTHYNKKTKKNTKKACSRAARRAAASC